MSKSKDRLVIVCQCNTHILKVERWHESRDGKQAESSFWFQYYDASYDGWWDRIKKAWEMLLYGECSAGDMIIERKDFIDLINFLEGAKGE